MKLSLLVIFLSLLVSCKKEDLGLQNHLKGKWELSRSWGPNFNVNLPPGNGSLFEFSETGFVRYSQHLPMQAGTYNLTPDTTSFNTHGTRITFLANGTASEKFLITSDTAIVFLEYGSAESSLYKRYK
jgi:hypothetical protein